LRPTAWLAPQLFSPNRPPRFLNWARPADLILRYRYSFLPKGILSRLTVRLHRFLSDPANAWRTGVLFEREATQVLVELLPEGSEIELRARGPERKELLSVVSSDLDALNDSFDGLKDKVDKLIPCTCAACAADLKPHFFEQKDLLRRREKGQRTAECKNSYAAADVRELLDGLKMDELPGWAKETPLRPIRIFLASSAELREDRDAFDLFVQRRNAELYKKGFILIVDRWEYFLDAISVTRLQDEYNKAVRNSDIFVSLFSTKVGKFTKEEFEVAYGQFQSTSKPRIYTYFKDAATTMSSVDEKGLRSLRAFQKQLGALGHFYTGYKDLDRLKLHFIEQLERLLQP
jgi:internalin A